MGRGLPCLDMQVSSKMSPSLSVTVGNPVIVGASGGPGNINIIKTLLNTSQFMLCVNLCSEI